MNPNLISAAPAAPQQFSDAKSAAAICARTAPSWVGAAQALKATGFAETQNPRFVSIQRAQRAVILEKAGTDVVVLLGSRANEGACIVGLRGMTPEQSFALAQLWARKFGALTNAERGQGLSETAVQAWGSLTDKCDLFIAAFHTRDLLGGPGAAARLFYVQR